MMKRVLLASVFLLALSAHALADPTPTPTATATPTPTATATPTPTATYTPTPQRMPAGGDLCGFYPDPSVCQIQGQPFSAATPADGQVPQFTSGTWTPTSPPYEVGVVMLGNPSAGATILQWVFARSVTFPAWPASKAVLTVGPSGGGVTFGLNKNGSPIGTVNFAGSATTGTFTFSSPVTFAAGDVLTITAPSPQDPALLNPTINLVGTR